MLFIRSFPCELQQTNQLADWLKELAVALETISYNRLRFVIHEAFVNACKHSTPEASHIIVMVRKQDALEIVVTDSGSGFQLPEDLSPFDKSAIGITWQLAVDRETKVHATIKAPNTLSFHLSEEQNKTPIMQLAEDRRGLISILKAAKDLKYHFVPNSFNYLHITC